MRSYYNLLYDILRFIYYKFFNKSYYKDQKTIDNFHTKEERLILEDLKKKGYAVIENFYSKEQCDKIVNEIELFCTTRSSEITNFKEFDNRIYGFNYASKNVELFLNNKKLIRILQTYSGKKLTYSFTLGQKTIYKENNPGSGLGWHLDHSIIKYPKALLYLIDVDKKNGPFQYIEATNRFSNKIQIRLKNNLDFNQGKFSDDEINNILKKNNFNLKTFSLKAGSLILFDGNGIHRGAPIVKNLRYSLTNYYYFNVKGGDDFPIINKN